MGKKGVAANKKDVSGIPKFFKDIVNAIVTSAVGGVTGAIVTEFIGNNNNDSDKVKSATTIGEVNKTEPVSNTVDSVSSFPLTL